ncbi:MAG TPA: dienelactone hydrolase family protein [Acidobacteriaceae bacterium]|jgi:carboxymethylenebutenolidase|nr:dienelactone hydrolase family protein [Acidobacteriaceae bacterium]
MTRKTNAARASLLAALLCLFLVPGLRAQTGQDVSFPAGAETAHGLLYTPAGDGLHPGLIVIHEWWGLNDWIKQQAQHFADQGYVVLAVDLYRGKVATDAETAHELSRGLPPDRAVRDLTAAADYLAHRAGVDPHSVGAIGWCMGGGYAAQLAVADPSLRAVVINYGSLPTDPASLQKIHAAVLGNFGAQDHGITPEDVHAFETALHSMGKSIDVKEYPDAGHAFENPNNTGGYRPDDARDAAERYDAFLASHLKGERK